MYSFHRTPNLAGKKAAYKLLVIQMVIMLLIAAGFLCSSSQSAVSALLGGLVCVIPNLYFINTVFAQSGATAARQVLHSFFIGEAIKIFITAALFAIIWKLYQAVQPVALFVGFIGTQFGQWFAPLVFKTHYQVKKNS